MNNNLMSVEKYAANESFQSFCLDQDLEAVTYWNQYLIENPSEKEQIEEAKKIVQILQLQLSKKEILIEKEKMKSFFEKAEVKQNISTRKNNTRNIWRKIASVAAVGLLLLGGLYFSGFLTETTPVYQTVNYTDQNEIKLSDGSIVSLSKDAAIKYEPTWTSNDTREIWLTGKAFFEVNKKPTTGKQQFIIHTTKGEVEVLGTSFTIENDEEHFAIILESGKLAFHASNKESITLIPGEKVFFENGKLAKEKVNPSHYSFWKKDKLIFEDQSVSEIVEVLKASFNLDILVENKSLLERKVNASIPINDPDLLLQALSEIYDIRIIRNKDQIILK